MAWKPHVTVAAVIEKNGRYLMVEETTEQGVAFNQPAGHIEPGEDLIAAIKREVLEETAWQFEPSALVGVQLWRKTSNAPTFLRFCFTGIVTQLTEQLTLDSDIIATHWLTLEEVSMRKHQLRSPLVQISLDQYLKGQRYPLTIIGNFLDLA